MNVCTDYDKRISDIETAATNLWKGHKFSPFFYTPHDTTHSKGVIEGIHKLIPDAQKVLSENEYFLLIASAWLHDIGMIPGLFQDDSKVPDDKDEYLRIRASHHLRSREYIIKEHNRFGLSEKEAKMVGLICKYHRRREDITEVSNLYDIRLQVLAAYLRLADAIHIDSSRVEEFQDLYNLLLAQGMPMESEMHWLRSFWIRSIEAKPDEAKIVVHFDFSKDEKVNDLSIIIDNAIMDLTEELDSCKDTLIKAGISCFIEVDHKYELAASDITLAKIKQVIAKLKMRYTASSSQLANIMIDTVNYLAVHYTGNDHEKIDMIKKYLETEVLEIRSDRPCHVLVSHIHKIVAGVIGDNNIDDEMKLELIDGKLKALSKERKKNTKIIAEHANSILADCGPILLFGYSSIIIEALDHLDPKAKENTAIYVLEGRNKNQHNYKNDLLYCDGLRYANDLSDRGFKQIYLVPDLIAGSLISSMKVEKILFGANTVDINAEFMGHTAGHKSIIHSAEKHKIPIYVLVDTYKFGELTDEIDTERKANWFTGKRSLQVDLLNKNVKHFNPRSYLIMTNDVHMFITDIGVFTPAHVPMKLKTRLDEIKKAVY